MEPRRRVDENVLNIHPSLKRLRELHNGLTLEGQATTGQAQASATDQSASQTTPGWGPSTSDPDNDLDDDDNYPHFADSPSPSPSPTRGGDITFTLDDLPNRLNWLLQASQQGFNVPCPTFDLVTAAAARDATWSALAATFTQKYRPGPFADYVEMVKGDMPIWTVLHDAMRRKDRKIDSAHYYREELEEESEEGEDEDDEDDDKDYDDDDDEAWLSDGDDPWYKPRN